MSPLDFNLPKNNSNVIKVIGVGGGGSNAVNFMYSKGIQGVDFVVCNTDAQALSNSPVPVKIQLGATLTEGLGAGADPEVGEQSALESTSDINDMFGEKTKMVFITVGMGGGTGTGAAPIIAKIAKERNLLTVGIVTTPFSFEGKTRNEQAQKGIDKLRENVDSLIVINNNKLREVYGNLGFKAGFSKADEVLATAAKGIAEVITHHYTQNIDFKDAKTVLENSGSAIMGSAKASGENRAQEAITKALESPLLNDNKITGAKNVLLLIVSGTEEITLDEIGEINDYIQSEAKTNVNIIMGVGEEESLGDAVAVTIVATGFDLEQQEEISKIENKRIIYDLNEQSFKEETTLVAKELKKDLPIQEEILPKKEERIVHNLEEDETVEDVFVSPSGQISLFDIDVADAEFISKKSVHVIDEEKKGFLNSEISSALSELKKAKTESKNTVANQTNLVETTKIIKDIPVVYDEVKEEEFIITQDISNIEVIDFQVVKPKEEEVSDHIAFDLPLDAVFETKKEEQIKNDLDEAKSIEVIDTEILSKNKVYDLEDYLEIENQLQEAKPVLKKEKKKEVVEPELDFQTKIVSKETPKSKKKSSDVSPLNSTISELKSRAQLRKEKMKEHNYKFRNSLKNNIDELEKQPAYKRNNIELDELDAGVKKSRTSLNMDGNDLNLRSNNSFLHDNVD